MCAGQEEGGENSSFFFFLILKQSDNSSRPVLSPTSRAHGHRHGNAALGALRWLLSLNGLAVSGARSKSELSGERLLSPNLLPSQGKQHRLLMRPRERTRAEPWPPDLCVTVSALCLWGQPAQGPTQQEPAVAEPERTHTWT